MIYISSLASWLLCNFNLTGVRTFVQLTITWWMFVFWFLFKRIIKEVVWTLEMWEFVTVCLSPDQPNIMYEVKIRTEPETDFSDPLSIPREKLVSTPHVICLLPNCDDVRSFVCSLQL